MRIVVVDFAASAGGGISILKAFYQHLIDSCDANEWIFVLNDDYIQQTENIKTVLLKKEKDSRFYRLAFDFVYGREFINSFNPDVVFYLQNTIIRGISKRQIMYMDQSIPFQKEKSFSFFKKSERSYAIYQHIIGSLNRYGCKKANHTIVQTKWLKDAVIEKCGISEKCVSIIPPNIPKICYCYHSNKIDNTSFFYPASNAVYKNHDCIYKALENITEACKVVLTIKQPEKPRKNCEYIGNVSLEEVYDRMQKSVLIFPSYIESYGLPLKEAMSIGTLVLAADTAFAREILSNYPNAYFFDPHNPSELSVLMKKVINGEIIHQEQGRVVFENQADSWSEVVKILKEVK